MTGESFYLIGYIIIVLILFLINPFRRFFVKHIPELLGFSSGYFFLLADIKSDAQHIVIFNETWASINVWLIILGIILGLVSILFSAIEKNNQKSVATLTSDLNDINNKLTKLKKEYYNLCSDRIKELFQNFLTTSFGNGRVSLYKHQGNKFVLLGRYSDNPMYKKSGRNEYPDNEGFIARGWANPTFEIHGIPNWVGKGKQYKSFTKHHCLISDQTLGQITMRSRSFYIYRVNNHDSQNPHGIIVFEKLDPSQIQTQTINQIFQTHEPQIVHLLKSMKSLFH